MTLSEYWHEGLRRLSGLYPEPEASSMLRILCEDIFGIPSYKIVTEPGAEAPVAAERALERLSCGEPLQYVLGYAEFRSRRFKVGPGVLIPRPETEQLVGLALEHLPQGGSAIDLCTGSGCIAWSLALESGDARVVGVDLSPEALGFAKGQEFRGGSVEFLQGDVLGDLQEVLEDSLPEAVPGALAGWEAPEGTPDARESVATERTQNAQRLGTCEGALDRKFDVLTSNPPYVMDSQKAHMRGNVLDWEPSMALFVADDDPLLFYRAIAGLAPTLLREGGYGIVEINDLLGPQTLGLFADAAGLRDATLIRDCFGRDRFVSFFRR